MTTIKLELSSEQAQWLADWSIMAGYKDEHDGVLSVLKVCGAIPRGSEYWKEKFGFAE